MKNAHHLSTFFFSYVVFLGNLMFCLSFIYKVLLFFLFFLLIPEILSIAKLGKAKGKSVT